ncbi:MAG: hypothetical protein C0600_03290 [Ignavibacteria bacterium]|nr:MAG: hypothetical protein C0600_03290 [Ignavibacteria bacterium]
MGCVAFPDIGDGYDLLIDKYSFAYFAIEPRARTITHEYFECYRELQYECESGNFSGSTASGPGSRWKGGQGDRIAAMLCD